MSGECVDLSQLRSLAPPMGEQAHVWLARVGSFAGQIEHVRALLTPAEQDRTARFVSVEAMQRFIVGRSVLRELLGAYLDRLAIEIAIEADANGKPWLAELDIPLRFNLAHSGDWVLLGFTDGDEIGVDIERHRRVAHWQGIAERHYSVRELAALKAARTEEQQELFFRIWTRKEAVLKWHGAGLQMPLSRIEMPIEQRCQAPVKLPETSHCCWVQPIDGPAGYSAALATSDPLVDVVQREVAWW